MKKKLNYKHNETIFVVASTLPISFIKNNFNNEDNYKIIVPLPDFVNSYSYLEKYFKNIKIIKAPHYKFFLLIYYSWLLVWVRLKDNRLIFFHECSNFIFDILVYFIKPKGHYFPIVTMNGFKEIPFSKIAKSKKGIFLRFIRQTKNFKYYEQPSVGNNEKEYAISIKKYPETIEVHEVNKRLLVNKNAKFKSFPKNILFILGKSFVSDKLQKSYYNYLIKIAIDRGYTCFIKDHPNKIYRINYKNKKTKEIDPLLPLELIEEDFRYVVGLSSTGMLSFGSRCICMLNLIEEMSYSNRKLCMDGLKIDKGNLNMIFIESFNDFSKVLEKDIA